MHSTRRQLRAWGWIAMLAVGALAFGPTLARALQPPLPALAPGPGALCHGVHEAGAIPATPATPAGPSVPTGAHHLEHCPLCTLSCVPWLVAGSADNAAAAAPSPATGAAARRPAPVAAWRGRVPAARAPPRGQPA